MRALKIVLAIILLLTIFIPINAIPPVLQAGTFETPTLLIAYPSTPYYPISENITINFHVFNSTGFVLDENDSVCTFHLFDNYGTNILDLESLNVSDKIFYVEIADDIFYERSKYDYIIHCNNSVEAGVSSSAFIVNGSGQEPTLSIVMYYMFLVTLFFILMIGCILYAMKIENIVAKFGFANFAWYFYLMFIFLMWRLCDAFLINVSFLIEIFRFVFIVSVGITGILIFLSLGFIILYIVSSKLFEQLSAGGLTKEQMMLQEEGNWFFRWIWRKKK